MSDTRLLPRRATDPLKMDHRIFAELFKDFPGPVVFGYPTGHADGPAITLPLGVGARVISGAPPRLVIEESAVQ